MIISYFQKNALQLSDWLELQSRKSRASHGDCLLALSDTSFKGQASNSIIMLWPMQVSVCESKHLTILYGDSHTSDRNEVATHTHGLSLSY